MPQLPQSRAKALFPRHILPPHLWHVPCAAASPFKPSAWAIGSDFSASTSMVVVSRLSDRGGVDSLHSCVWRGWEENPPRGSRFVCGGGVGCAPTALNCCISSGKDSESV